MATKQQIPVLAARFVEFQEEFSNLSIEDAQWAIMHGKEATALSVRAIIDREKKRLEEVKLPILGLIFGGEKLSIKALDGKRLIYNSKKTFKAFIDEDFKELYSNEIGVATPETAIQVHEIVRDCTFMDTFVALPGTWNQKWLSQNQMIEFCETLTNYLNPEYVTIFLIKKDESKSVDEANPQNNLAVVYVDVNFNGLRVYVLNLEYDLVLDGKFRHRVVSPLIAL